MTFTLRHAMHFVVVTLLAAAVLHAAAVGGGSVHGLGRTTAATGVAVVFLAVYLLGLRVAPDSAGLRDGASRDRLLSGGSEASAAVWTWLVAMALVWSAGVLVTDGFVWVALPLHLLALALLPGVAGAMVVAGLVVLSVGLGLLHGHTAGVTTALDVWLGMLVPACVALIGWTVFMQLREDAQRQRELVARLREAQDCLAATERTQGVLAERERLAREIHDTLGQALASIVVLARTAGPQNPEALALIESTARDNLIETRRFIRDLAHPGEATLEDSARLIAQDALRLSEAAGETLTVDVVVEGTPPRHVDDHIVAALHRGIQASMSNVLRHAQATRCQIGIGWFDDRVVVDVIDNGVGFDPRTVDADAHFGLQALHSRMEEVAIDVIIDSSPGEGTTVALTAHLTPTPAIRDAPEVRP